MISIKLADIFTNLAEVKKADPAGKKDIPSLMSAARTLRDDPGIVDIIIKGNNPGKLYGVNEYCQGLVREYLEKGTIKEYDKFSSSYSEDLVRFIRMTGLGRKRLFSIYDAYGINDIDDLKDVFKDRAIKDILKASPVKKDILSPLFAERIQKTLEYFEGIAGKTPRWPAQLYAAGMIDSIEKLVDVKRVECTGSVRRKKSLIGDIDLLVLPAFNLEELDPARSFRMLEKMVQLPFIKKLISVKKAKEDISAVYNTIYDIDVEIIVACERTWAWQLFKTTGSKKHLSELEEYAWKNKRQDLASLSRQGLGSEKKIYRSLGLEYIPVELREGRDEVILSSRKRLPDLVNVGDLRGDLHIHSQWSDGLIEYPDIIDTAKKMDYEYIAISDHSVSNYYGNGLDTERLLKKLDFIKELRDKYSGIDILMGAEIDVKKADIFDYSPDVIKKLDIAIASLHSGFINSIQENTFRAISALKKDYFDLMAHPTGIVFGNRAPIFIDMNSVIQVAAENGKALEINSYYMRLDLDEKNARKAAEAGARLSINTDSHRAGNMEMIQLGVDVARRAGLESKDIINTMTADELKSWRQRRKR